MGWTTAYLVVAIILLIVGIWNLARQRYIFLSLVGVLWFLVVLSEHYIPSVYNYRFADGVPAVGTLVLYLVVPIFLFIAFLSTSNRR